MDEDICYNEHTGIAINFEKIEITSSIEPDKELEELVQMYLR